MRIFVHASPELAQCDIRALCQEKRNRADPMVFDPCLPDGNDRNGTDAGRFGTESAIYVCRPALYGFFDGL